MKAFLTILVSAALGAAVDAARKLATPALDLILRTPTLESNYPVRKIYRFNSAVLKVAAYLPQLPATLSVNQRHTYNILNMLFSPSCLNSDCSQQIVRYIVKILCLSEGQNSPAITVIQELARLIEQLKGVPLGRIVAGCKNDSAPCLFSGHSHLNSGRCGKANIRHIDSNAAQRPVHKRSHQFT